MKLTDFLEILHISPERIEFSDTMAIIDTLYDFTPTAFQNGVLMNQAGENLGSCKLFAFALQCDLSKADTLACFGSYYREDVLQNPQGANHQNIRNFIQTAWQGVHFAKSPLQLK
jgi:hypothetical protein